MFKCKATEIEDEGTYWKWATEPVLWQVQQPSKATWLPGEVEAQHLDTYETPPLFALKSFKNK